MNREELLSRFEYPEVNPSSLDLIVRMTAISHSPHVLIDESGGRYPLSNQTKFVLGQDNLEFTQAEFVFQKNDWVGLKRNSQNQIVEVQMLAPARREKLVCSTSR